MLRNSTVAYSMMGLGLSQMRLTSAATSSSRDDLDDEPRALASRWEVPLSKPPKGVGFSDPLSGTVNRMEDFFRSGAMKEHFGHLTTLILLML